MPQCSDEKFSRLWGETCGERALRESMGSTSLALPAGCIPCPARNYTDTQNFSFTSANAATFNARRHRIVTKHRLDVTAGIMLRGLESARQFAQLPDTNSPSRTVGGRPAFESGGRPGSHSARVFQMAQIAQ